MAPARPIHDIFAGLAEPGAAEPGTADPAAALREGGHSDLADVLVAEAIVSYAGTAPAEVAEHLAPFVTAHSPVPAADPDAAVPDLADGLALLVTAPVVAEPEPALPAGEEDVVDFGGGEFLDGAVDPMDLDFGEGAGVSEPQAAVESVEFDLSPTQPEPDPGEPEPTEPDPTQPGPTEPGPIEPDPTEDTLGEA